jgi:hypothetical protein
MAFVIKTRGAPRPVRSDFRCPVHGVFTRLVDSGTECVACPAIVQIPMDAFYPSGGSYICGQPSPWSPSVIPMRMRRVEATRGASEKPPHKDWDFTANLEEGQDPDEYQADCDARAERRREQLVMDAVRDDR